MRIKKGDKVMVISGASKGKTGTVLRSFPGEEAVIVEGVNVKKRHLKPNRQTKQGGGIVERATPIAASKVALIDPKTSKPTRVRMEEKDGKKTRVAVKSGSTV